MMTKGEALRRGKEEVVDESRIVSALDLSLWFWFDAPVNRQSDRNPRSHEARNRCRTVPAVRMLTSSDPDRSSEHEHLKREE